MPSSASSMIHSEGTVSSSLLSGTQSSFSSTSRGRRVNGSSRRRGRASERSIRRSVEFAEAPQPRAEKSDACSSHHGNAVGDASSGTHPYSTCNGDNGHIHRRAACVPLNYSSRFRMDEHVPYMEIRKKVEKDVALSTVTYDASPILPPRPGTRVDETATSDDRTTGSSPACAVPIVVGGTGGSSTPPSYSSSLTSSSSLSLTHRADSVAAIGHNCVAKPLAPAALFSKNPLEALPSEYIEAALQLYVERGGVHAGEVTAMLQALPWCTTAAAHASLASVDANTATENVDEGAEQQLLDPETWLRAVVAATASAVAAAGDDERAGAAAPSAATPIASMEVAAKAQSQSSTAEEAPATVSQLSDFSDPSAPVHVERTAEKRCNSVEFANEAAAAVDRTFVGCGAGRLRRRRSDLNTEVGGRSCLCDDDSASFTLQENGVDSRDVFPDRKLAYDDACDDAGNDAAARVTGVECSFSLPQLARRHRSGSAQHRQPQQLLSSLTSDVREPQSAYFYSSVSPVLCSTNGRRSSHASQTAFSQAYSPVSVAAEKTEAAPATTASTFATASTTTADIHTLFQYCLQAPLTTTSSTLRVSDWHTLLDQLQRDGHHKMPPQPILDDVTRTIAHTMYCEGHPGGLTLSDFTRVMQRQLEEVRADMMELPSPDAAASDGTVPCEDVTLHFPTYPEYVLTLPTSSVSAQSTSFPSRRSIRCRSSTEHALTPGSNQLRVLPTWCMALAALFPREMSRICPVPVVRYLRSVGLIRAVLKAIIQRLQLELDATPEYVSPVASAAGRAAQNRCESTAVESCAWRPQREGSGRSGSVSSLLPLSGASAVVRTPSWDVATGSAVGTSSDGNWLWKERPVWCSVASDRQSRRVTHRKRRAASNMEATLEWLGGEGSGIPSCHPHATTNGSSRLVAGVTASTSSDAAKPHYLDQRPLDEISASVVARAKARRVMDTLRRHTVPINRYECFARVEPESDPVQEPMCFVSKEELKAAFSGNGSSDSDEDSDAMPNMIAALTYDPQREVAADLTETVMKGDGSVAVDQDRSSQRPPPQPRMPASNVLPTVIIGATRASMPVRRRSPNGGAGMTLSPPPPAPCMFRMSGLLPTALPREQEEALVHRLSKPVCDPVAMSRHAASIENAYTRGHSVDITGFIPTSDSELGNAKVVEGRPTRSASRPPSGSAAQGHHWLHPYLMRHKSSSDTASRAGRFPHSRNYCRRPRSCPSSVWTDPYYASVCASHRDQLPSSSVSRTSGGGACASKLTAAQNRGFFLFDVPSVLVTAPLSSAAAAAASVQVIASGDAPCASSSAGVVLRQQSAAHRLEGYRALSRGAPRGATRAGSAAPLRPKAKGKPTGGRRAGSISSSAVAKPARCGSSSRLTPPYPREAPQRERAAAHPRGADSECRAKVADATAAAHPPASYHSQPHISLYERRLHRQLQLAYANEHV